MSESSSLAQRLQVLEDIEAIRVLKARYCAACDDDHNPETLGTLFAENAVWEASSMGRAVGRRAIQEMLGDVGRSGLIKRSAHNVFNPQIEVKGDQATGHWRLVMLYTANLPDGGVNHQRIIGWYREQYARIDGRWFFTDLYCEVEESGPYQMTGNESGNMTENSA